MCFPEWANGPVYRSQAGLHQCGGNAESGDGDHYHDLNHHHYRGEVQGGGSGSYAGNLHVGL